MRPYRPLPPPLTLQELRNYAQAHRGDPVAQRLLWEIRRLHGVISQAESLRSSIQTAWRELDAGNLTALHQMKALLSDEPAMESRPDQRPNNQPNI